MMTVCLRRLAGLTSFMSKRHFSHFPSIGPDGILESSIIFPSAQPAGEHRNRHGDETHDNNESNNSRGGFQALGVALRDPAQRLQSAPNPMVEVQAQGAHRDD